MNCAEFEELLQRRLDGEALPERGKDDAHLAACSECRERHAAALLLLVGLNALPRPVPPPDLARNAVAKILADRRKRLRRRVGLAAGFAMAASVLIAAFGLGWFDNLWGPRENVIVEGPKVEEVEPLLTHGLAEAKTSLAGLVERTAEQPAQLFQASSASLEFVSLDTLPRFGAVVQPLETTGASLQQGGKNAAIASRAVSGLTRRALGYFLSLEQNIAPARDGQNSR